MKNTIAERVGDFLKRYPPFDLLLADQLLEISKEVTIKYFEKSETIFTQGHTSEPHFYMIYKGAITLKKEVDSVSGTVDKFDEGDIFGLHSMFEQGQYTSSAFADEESILYTIPLEFFHPLVEENKGIGQFLLESYNTNTEHPYSRKLLDDLYLNEKDVIDVSDEIFELQPVRMVKNAITARPETEIRDIAKLMKDHDIGSVIIEKEKAPVGIITADDLINLVATGEVSVNEKADSIMARPVLCYPKNVTLAQAQITMLKHNIDHICITKDGTPHSKIIGVVSQHDLRVMKASNPSVLMRAISRADSTKKLKRIRVKIMMMLKGYVFQNIPMTHISKIMFELNDATIKRIIERSIQKMEEPPPVKFAWMSLGSQGRKEQLLHTDQDNALIFEDVDEKKIEEARAYFKTLAQRVNKRLNKVGFEFCKADIMAKNPKWCLSLSEWKDQFNDWTKETDSEEILLFSIFFDFDISYGNVELVNSLADHVYLLAKDRPIFIKKLAASALRSPSPFGIFRQFLVEADGAYKDFFDLKKRGLMPFIDAARVLALDYQLKNINNTADRFEKMADLVPENKDLYMSCSYSSKALLKFRTKHGLLQNDSGRFIDLSILTKEEKLKLKRCFKTLSRIQQLLKLKYGINQYMQ